MRTLLLVMGLVWIVGAIGCDAGAPSSSSAPAGSSAPAASSALAGGSVVAEISQQTLLSAPPEGALVLDVRTPEEYAAGHVPNAVNIPHDQLADELGKLGADKNRNVVVYCKSGRRAGLATEVLAEAGFTRIHHLSGDMDGWVAAGLPLE